MKMNKNLIKVEKLLHNLRQRKVFTLNDVFAEVKNLPQVELIKALKNALMTFYLI